MSQEVAILVFVLAEALERVETAANAVLSAVNDGSLSNTEARQVLTVCKPAIAALVTAQTAAARVMAGTERHGDGGAQVLADAAGLTRREAHSQIKTAETLQAAPVLREAVESGRVSPANAKRLAEAITKTDANTVVSDGELLAQAVSLRPEQFTRVARRWTADHQADGGEGGLPPDALSTACLVHERRRRDDSPAWRVRSSHRPAHRQPAHPRRATVALRRSAQLA